MTQLKCNDVSLGYEGKTIIEYAPTSPAAVAYVNLAKEVIARNGNK